MNGLEGKTILITRPEPFASELAKEIRLIKGSPLVFPVIQIEEPSNPSLLEPIFSTLLRFDWAIFVSPTAVLRTFSRFQRQHWPRTLRIASMGEGTAKQLTELGLSVSIVPPFFNSESLLATPQLQEVKGKKCLIIAGEGGRELLANTLEQRGAEITYARVYRRVLPSLPGQLLLSEWQMQGIDAIVISSVEALSNLIFLMGQSGEKWLKNQLLIVTSPSIQTAAIQKRFKSIYLADNASHSVVITKLKMIFAECH